MKRRMTTNLPQRNPVSWTQISPAHSLKRKRTGSAGHASSSASHPGRPMRSSAVGSGRSLLQAFQFLFTWFLSDRHFRMTASCLFFWVGGVCTCRGRSQCWTSNQPEAERNSINALFPNCLVSSLQPNESIRFWLIWYEVLWTAFTMGTDCRTHRTRPGPLRGNGSSFWSTGWIT